MGATAPKALVAAVAEYGADCGVALDVMTADRLVRREPVPGVVGKLMTDWPWRWRSPASA
ncbi:MAG: hypothetical protein ABS56_04740 [Lautropia sp. SCN 69-89]|nr:MAG: hypothetical protein ABS56_04740 [Lautropia sp. SCN 69-89]